MSRFLFLALFGGAALLACKAPTGEEGPVGSDGVGAPGQQGPAAERTPTLTSISPQRAFLGRQTEVLISGADTDWSSDSPLEFQFGPGVEVASFTVASPTAVVATIDVQDEAVLGLRTVRVRNGAAEAASLHEFAIDPSLEVIPAAVDVKGQQNFRQPFQGSIIQGVAFELDERSPFDPVPSQVDVSIGGGSTNQVQILESGTILIFWAEIDVFADPGLRRVVIESGPPDSTVRSVTAYEPIEILARAPTPLALGSNPGVFGVPDASRLYSIDTGGQGKLLTFAISGEAPEALADLIILPDSGKFSDALARRPKVSTDAVVLNAIVPAESEQVFLVYRGFGGGGGYEFDIAVEERLTSTIDPLTGSSTAGEIGVPRESDWFQFEGEAGTKVHLEVVSAGAEACGSWIAPGGINSEMEVFDESGKRLGFNDDLGPNFCSSLDVDLPSTGTYFVRVSASQGSFTPDDTFAYLLAFAEL